jgi:hypothetical protein
LAHFFFSIVRWHALVALEASEHALIMQGVEAHEATVAEDAQQQHIGQDSDNGLTRPWVRMPLGRLAPAVHKKSLCTAPTGMLPTDVANLVAEGMGGGVMHTVKNVQMHYCPAAAVCQRAINFPTAINNCRHRLLFRCRGKDPNNRLWQ